MIRNNPSLKSESIHILLAIDYPLILVGIRAILATDTDLVVIGEATDCAEIQHLNQELKPDVLLLDLKMFEILPVERITHLHQQSPTTAIVILVNGDNNAIIYDLIASGVVGCVSKTEPAETIVQAIRSVAQGGIWFSQSIVVSLIQKPVQAEIPNLTEEELVVLRLMIAGKTDRQIGRELSLSERTVRYRLQNVYDKLEVNTRIEAAVQAVRLGLV